MIKLTLTATVVKQSDFVRIGGKEPKIFKAEVECDEALAIEVGKPMEHFQRDVARLLELVKEGEGHDKAR